MIGIAAGKNCDQLVHNGSYHSGDVVLASFGCRAARVGDHAVSSQHAQQGVTLRGFPCCRSRRVGRPLRMVLHSKAWQLARLAAFEFGALWSQCLDCRIPDKQALIDEIAAWEDDRNANHTKAEWHFTTPIARIKLKNWTLQLD
jgi:hypothetical protein